MMWMTPRLGREGTGALWVPDATIDSKLRPRDP